MSAGGTVAEAVSTPLPAGPKTEIPSVDWWTTSHCNLACDFCYGPVPGKDPVERRPDILEALAASSARAVTFCGGEPLLLRKIGEYAGTLRQCGKSTVLNTNGELLRRRLDQGLRLADFALVGISVEGSTPEVHRAMRGDKADFDEVMAAARLVAAKPGVSLKLATVVSGVNRNDLPELARTVRELAPDVWRLYQYSSRGDQNTGQRRHSLPDEEFQYLVKEAAEPGRTGADGAVRGSRDGRLPHRGSRRQRVPAGRCQVRLAGNCLEDPLDHIWAQLPARSTIINNKRWLSVLS